MNLRDIIFGIGWLILGNIGFYFLYPLFVAFMGGLTNPSLGELALGSSLEGISWFGYLFMWALVGFAIPVYFIIKGASRD